MTNLIKVLVLFFFTQKESVHVQVQNVEQIQPEKLHTQRCPAPQKKLFGEPDEGRDTAVDAVLPAPIGVHVDERWRVGETCVGFLEK